MRHRGGGRPESGCRVRQPGGIDHHSANRRDRHSHADGHGIASDGSYVYLAADPGSAFTENGTSGSGQLYIGQYLSREDRGGVAPTVQITGPLGGSTFIEGTTVPIRVQASDDVAVVAVDFLVDGQAVFTDTSEPYQFNLTAPVGARSVTLGARAIDLGNNVGNATTVQINVIPDPFVAYIRNFNRLGRNVSPVIFPVGALLYPFCQQINFFFL